MNVQFKIVIKFALHYNWICKYLLLLTLSTKESGRNFAGKINSFEIKIAVDFGFGIEVVFRVTYL